MAAPARLHQLRYRNSSDDGEGFFGSCDFTSYCYFFLAVILFTVGTVVTIYALDVGSASLFSSLGHMWLLGPIFISSGVMVAVKTVLYLRKKNLLAFIIRQSAMFRELQGTAAGSQFNNITRNPSTITLPPLYDVAVGQFTVSADCPLDGRFADVEAPPPSYEEAMLLVCGDTRFCINSRQIETQEDDNGHITSKDANG